VYVINRDSKKYLIDQTLTELEQELDHAIFFRANRQYIVNLNFIKSFKPYEKVKLLLAVNVHDLAEPVIVSQQVAPVFKKWINDA
jgi:two-component system, LytTR family, response regulator